MYNTSHLPPEQDINTDILDAIKAAFKNQSITIIVEEGEPTYISAKTPDGTTLQKI